MSTDPRSADTHYTRTPLFEAYYAARYERQALIREIQHSTSTRLISYVSSMRGGITRDDIMPFMDLLHNIPASAGVDLLLHTPGGDIDAAEKLISMVRDKTGGAPFRIIVPDFAKSAGTLMVLGADKVVMSDTSELGPIDPQIFAPDMSGQWRWLPTQSYLDAFEEHATILSNDPSNVPARIMIEKLDPPFLQLCRALKSRAQRLAEKHLREGMFRSGTGNTTKTASELLDTNRWLTHSQVISWRDAQAPPIELDVEYLEPQSDLWQKYWRLYCLQRLATSDRQILFESDYVSLPIDGPAG